MKSFVCCTAVMLKASLLANLLRHLECIAASPSNEFSLGAIAEAIDAGEAQALAEALSDAWIFNSSFQRLLTWAHDATGLPWWACLARVSYPWSGICMVVPKAFLWIVIVKTRHHELQQHMKVIIVATTWPNISRATAWRSTPNNG